MLKQFSSLAIALLALFVSSSEGARRGPIPSLEIPHVAHWQGRLAIPVATGAHRSHTVQSGDTLWGIARRYGLTFNELASLNKFDAETVIRIGDKVRLPGAAGRTRRGSSPAASTGQSHTVTGGETLYRISRRYGVSVEALKQANGIDNPSGLRAGDSLNIPGASSPAPKEAAPSPKPIVEEKKVVVETAEPEAPEVVETAEPGAPEVVETTPATTEPPRRTKTLAPYHVQTGDTPESIAQTYGLTVAQLQRVNGRSPDELFSPKAGDKVLVPTDGSWYIPESPIAQVATQTAPSTLDRTPYRKNRTMLMTHVVSPNDDLATLAKRFGTTVDQIRLENPGIRSNRDLRVGADLKIRIPRPL